MPKKPGIYKRADGRFACDVYLGNDPATGRTLRKRVYGATAREVEQKRAELLRQIDRGLDPLAAAQTVQGFLAAWLEDTVKRHKKPRTYRFYQEEIERHIVPHLGRIQLDALRPGHVQKMLNALTDSGLSARTVQHARAVLRNALNVALRHGLVTMNAAALAEGPAVEKFRGKTLTADQAKALLTQVEGHRLAPLYHLALLGLRQGEVIALRWSDIDFETGVLTIQQGKTVNARRVLPLSSATLDRLAQHWSFQQQEREIHGAGWNSADLVFPSQFGTPLMPRNLVRHFKRQLELAGLPDVRFHDLRHTAASLMQAAGVPLRVVSELLGHADTDITQQVYTHALDAEKSRATAYLDA